jgi:hypothetical protein
MGRGGRGWRRSRGNGKNPKPESRKQKTESSEAETQKLRKGLAELESLDGEAVNWEIRKAGKRTGKALPVRKSFPERLLQNSVAADVSRRKHLKLARTNVRGYEVLKKPPEFLSS